MGLLLGTGTGTAAPQLEVQIIQTGADSLYTNITLVKGEKNAVLVDAPLTRADAHRTVAAVLESGRTLETLIITHAHPDHFFGAEVIVEAFPNVRVVTAPQIVDDIREAIPVKLKRWGPILGMNGPRHLTAPSALEKPYVELEGHRLEVLGPMQGDHAHSLAVWVPDAKTLIAGDLLFNEMHVWVSECTKDARLDWVRSVDKLAQLGATTVVAGHKKPGLPDDASSIAYTKKYLETFERTVATSKNSAQLAASIRSAFPNTIDVSGDFLLGNSSKVAMGERPIWRE